ncbi:MAG: hypothetical protein ABI898_10565 [Sphingomonadales bacterium]
MKAIIPVVAALMLGASGAAMAQVDSQSNTINTARVATANADVAAEAHAEAAMNAEQKEQYAKDMTSYREALRAQNRAEVADAIRYERQQRAYANAMYDWRLQANACKRGNTRACNAPTPNPADYY